MISRMRKSKKEEKMHDEILDELNRIIKENEEDNKFKTYEKCKEYLSTVILSSDDYDFYIAYITEKLKI